MSDSLWPHGLQHARLPYPSLPLRVCSNSCPLSRWCHSTISSRGSSSSSLSAIRVVSSAYLGMQMGTPDHLTCLLRNRMQVKQQLEPDVGQWTGSKLGKEYIKAVYCHPAYLTYMQSTSCEMPSWMKHKLESRLLGEISIPQIRRWQPPYGRKWRRTKEPLDESERGEWKSWLGTQY